MAKTKNIKPFDEQDTRLAMGQDAGMDMLLDAIKKKTKPKKGKA